MGSLLNLALSITDTAKEVNEGPYLNGERPRLQTGTPTSAKPTPPVLARSDALIGMSAGAEESTASRQAETFSEAFECRGCRNIDMRRGVKQNGRQGYAWACAKG